MLNDPAVNKGRVELMIRNAIEDSMRDRGWMRGGSTSSDVQLGYVAALSTDMDDAAIVRQFGVSPGLPSAGTPYGKGTLIIILRKPGLSPAVWRGAAQILADLELPDDVREARIRNVVRLLLSNVPMR
jgi:hypothetical protein